MNRYHRWYCRSDRWGERVRGDLLPWVLDGVDLGRLVLEVGPGPGITTDVLRSGGATVVGAELDAALAAGLHRRLAPAGTGPAAATGGGGPGGRSAAAHPGPVAVCRADGTALPFASGSFTGAACCTVLHHVPSAGLQDRILAEVRRVLRPGAWFAGCDSRPSTRFRLVHLFDTQVVVDPGTFADRLHAAGFGDVGIDVGERSFRFRARVPATRSTTSHRRGVAAAR